MLIKFKHLSINYQHEEVADLKREIVLKLTKSITYKFRTFFICLLCNINSS